MRAGDLRRQVTLQERSETKDSAGQRVRTWTDVAVLMAQILPLSGRELELAQATSAEITHQVIVRWRANLTTAMRLVYQGRIFNIHSVLDMEMRHRQIVMGCSEGLNDGE